MTNMHWIKKGLSFNPAGKVSWATHSALQPTPLLLNESTIRIFTGMRDEEGVARVGYVDVNAQNPSEILAVSERPCFDIGEPGHFDDNGVVPCCVVRRDGALYLYYAGYQLMQKVRFLVFGGLAVSHDNGESFTRVQTVPVVDRAADETLFKVIHTALHDDDTWKIWYGGGSGFQQGKAKTLPVYDIRYTESADGIDIPKKGKVVLETSADEYRIARPNVIKKADGYHMFLCHGSETDPYSLGYAFSKDGIAWTRNDAALNLQKTPGDWDSDMMAYPGYIACGDKAYLFYNGNNYGREGFGYAVLDAA